MRNSLRWQSYFCFGKIKPCPNTLLLLLVIKHNNVVINNIYKYNNNDVKWLV